MVNVGTFLTQRARLNPDREGYVDGGTGFRLSFAAINARSNRAANAMLALGAGRGDRVAIMLMNSAEFVELYFGLAKIGVISVPLNWRLATDELSFILKDSGADILIYGSEFADAVHCLQTNDTAGNIRHWVEVGGDTERPLSMRALDYAGLCAAASSSEPEIRADGEDILFIMYTSGTTGIPKGVVHTHDTCFWSVLTFCATHDLYNGDRYLAALPMFHVGSLTPIAVNVYSGVTSIVMREFDASRAWALIERERVTASLLVPAMLNFMRQVPEFDQADVSRLRWIQAGAAPVPVELIRGYEKRGIEIQQIYGLTESGGPACLIDAENALRKVGSTGKAFFHTEVRIVDEDGKTCPPGVHGEIWIRGRHVMAGYWKRPEETAFALQDGWLRTGDGAVQDADGYIFIQDRIKDMIISGGENIYPAEIENVLLSHPGVREVAVIGQPSARWGESPLAVVVPRGENITAQTLLDHCQERLARYKLPQRVAFVDSIPRNPSGKILKRVLRERFPGPAPV